MTNLQHGSLLSLFIGNVLVNALRCARMCMALMLLGIALLFTQDVVANTEPTALMTPTLEQQILQRLAEGLPVNDLLSAYQEKHPSSQYSKTRVEPVSMTQQIKSSIRNLNQVLTKVRDDSSAVSHDEIWRAYQQVLASLMVLEHALADTNKKLQDAGLTTIQARQAKTREILSERINTLRQALSPLAQLSPNVDAESSSEVDGESNIIQKSKIANLSLSTVDALQPLLKSWMVENNTAQTLRASLLPARARNLPARQPAATTIVMPAYEQSDESLPQMQVAVEDIEATTEVVFADEILAQAAALKYDYAAIYEYVRNNIHTEWYAGSARGALGALRAQSGNDVDQASLLIALLRASGAPARYVHGVVELPVETVAESLNLVDVTQVPDALARAGVAHRNVVRGGRVAAVEIEHTWVTARVPYTNYRGALVDATGPTWLPLDPSIKSWKNVASSTALPTALDAIGGSAALVNQWLQEAHDVDFLNVLRTQIKDQLQWQDSDYETQLGSQAIKPQTIGLLPNTLPYKTIAVTEESAALSDARRTMIRVALYDDTEVVFDAHLPLSEIAQNRLTLSYQPATLEDHRTTLLYGGMDLVPIYLISLRPELKLAGKQVAIGGKAVASGKTVRLEWTIQHPAGFETVSQSLQTGAYHAFAVGIGEPTRGALAGEDLESEAARQLDGFAVAYSRAWHDAENELAALNNTPVVRPYPAIATVSTAFAVESIGNVPYTQKWRGVVLDAVLRVAEPIGSQNARRDWLRLSALQGSSLEHFLFEERFLVDAISADKGLGLSSGHVVTLDNNNLNTMATALSLDAAVINDLRDWLHLGYNIRMIAQPLQRNIWQGVAWWVEDPVSGSAGWFISGRLAGGSTTEDPANWALKFLADAFASAYSPAANEDPLAGTSIIRVTSTDGQEGIVNQILSHPLQVMVRDKDGRPVKGASVTFSATRGGGEFVGGNTVTTDDLGIASIRYRLGKSTSDWPVYVKKNEGDEYYTLAGYNAIDAVLRSATGNHSLDAPFIATALPGEVVKLVRTDGGSLEGSANLSASTAILRATDTYDNPVANIEVTATGGAPEVNCEYAPKISPQPAKFANAETGASGCVAVPTSKDCGQTPLMLKTREDGTVAFRVFLGNSNSTRYPVVFSGANVTLTQNYQSKGACNDGPALYILYTNAINNHGNISAATNPATTYAETLDVRLFYTSPSVRHVRVPVSNDPTGEGVCQGIFITDRELVPVLSAEVSFEYSNGGIAMPAIADGNGRWSTQMTTGAFPALNAGTASVTNAETKWGTTNTITCEEGTPKTVYMDTTGDAPSVWAVTAQITDIQSLDVEKGVDSGRLYLNDDGGTSYPFEIRYQLNPAAYGANYVDVVIYEKTDDQIRHVYYSQKGTSDSGTGSIRVERGFPLTNTSTYTAQVRVNAGTVNEVLSEEVELPLQQRIIRSYTSQARMQTDVDLANNRACRLGSRINYYLNRNAYVTLTADPLDDSVNDPQPIGSPETLINDKLTEEGENVYLLDPEALLPRRNGYLFTLKAVSEDGAIQEEVQGIIRVGLRLSDALPVQQTLVKGVNIKSGRLIAAGLGFDYQGRGPQLAFHPMYSSAGSDDVSAMGYGWTHNLEASLQITPCGDVYVQTGDGGSVRFLAEGNGFKPAKGYHGTLIANNANHTFDFYSKNGTRYHFIFVGGTQQWRLSSIADPNDNALELSYHETSASGQALLKQAKDSAGRILSYQYETRNFAGNLVSALVGVSGSSGVSFILDYDSEGNLTTLTKNGAAQENFAYEIELPGLRHLLTKHTNANGDTTTYNYDTTDISYTLPGSGNINLTLPNGRISAIIAPDGGKTGFAYGSAQVTGSQTTRVTNPGNGVTTYTTDAYGSAVRIDAPAGTTTFNWETDTDLLLKSRTDPGGITTSYEYDAAGNITKETIGGVFTSSATWLIQDQPPYIKALPTSQTDRNGNITRYDYDGKGNLKTERRPESVTLNYTYTANGDRKTFSDGEGNTTHYTWDTYGLLDTEQNALGNKIKYQHDARGRLTKITDPEGNATQNEYDDLDRISHTRYPDGGITYYEYDNLGNKTKETDPEGRETQWTYDAMGRVLTHTTPVGKKTTTYDLAGNKKTESNWRGEAMAEYDYDTANRLIQETKIGSIATENKPTITRYRYDAASNIEADIDSVGRETKYEYDALKRRTKTTNTLGHTTKTVYDGNGNIKEEIDAEGNTTRHDYDGLNRKTKTTAADGGVTQWTYDKADNIRFKKDPRNHTWEYRYDAANRLKYQITPEPQKQQTAYDYDASGNLISEINPRIYSRVYTYDSMNRRVTFRDEEKYTTRYTYDKVGNLKTETQPNRNVIIHDYDALNRKTSSKDDEGSLGQWNYDADGNLIKETDGNGNTTVHDFDAANRRTKTQLPKLGNEPRTITYTHDVHGNLKKETTPAGNEIVHSYDDINRRIKTSDKLGLIGEYGYDKVGNLVLEKNGEGQETRTTYDALNRPVKVEDQIGVRWQKTFDLAGNLKDDTDGNGIKTQYTYDQQNRKTTTTRANLLIETLEYDAADNLLFKTDAKGNKEGWEYDGRNLVIAYNRLLAAITTYTRDNMGDVKRERDPEGRTIENTYDQRRRLKTQTVKGPTAADDQTTEYWYDANNNITRTQHPKGNNTRIAYNADNQPNTITTETGQSTLAYNPDGTLKSRTDAEGHTVHYTLDTRNRRTQITYPDGTGQTTHTFDLADRVKTVTHGNSPSSSTITTTHEWDVRNQETERDYNTGTLNKIQYTYDGNGNRTKETTTDQHGVRSHITQYDNFNRPEHITDAYGNQIRHTFDLNGNKATTTTNNQTTRYHYDILNRLTGVESTSGTVQYTYDRSGKVTQTKYSGQLTTDQTWDHAGRLTERTHKKNGQLLQSYHTTYDKNGNKTAETKATPNNTDTTQYTYDQDDRLTGVTRNNTQSETYQLDNTGNRTQITRTGYATNNGTTVNTFDARGRITQSQTPNQTTTYTWDQRGNLTETNTGSQTIQYTWNAENQLTQIRHNGTPVANYRYTKGLRDQTDDGRTVWDDQFAFIEQDNTGHQITRTEHAGNKALFLTGTQTEILLRDGLDSITGTINPNSTTPQSQTDYTAWGEASQTGTTQTKHGYTGHIQDATGLIYARARYYDPSIGRFISQDPLEGILDSPISWNAYLYANANPLRYIDPTGLQSFPFHPGTVNYYSGAASLYRHDLERGASQKEIKESQKRYAHRGNADFQMQANLKNAAYTWAVGATLPFAGAAEGAVLAAGLSTSETIVATAAIGMATDMALQGLDNAFFDTPYEPARTVVAGGGTGAISAGINFYTRAAQMANASRNVAQTQTVTRVDDVITSEGAGIGVSVRPGTTTSAATETASNNHALIGLIKPTGVVDETLKARYIELAQSEKFAQNVENYNRRARVLGETEIGSIDEIIAALETETTFTRVGHLKAGIFPEGKHLGNTKYWLQANPDAWYGSNVARHEMLHLGAMLRGQKGGFLHETIHEIAVQTSSTPGLFYSATGGAVMGVGGVYYFNNR